MNKQTCDWTLNIVENGRTGTRRQMVIPPLPSIPAEVAARKFVSRFIKVKMIIAVVLVVGAIAAVSLKSALSISTTGTSIGKSFRAGNNIVTLIRTLEPYIPTLHRNRENYRYRVGLLVSPVDDPSHERLIPIRDGFRPNDLQLAHVIGFDGINVWCDVDQLQGVNLQTGKLVGAAKLREVNPDIDDYWDDLRRISCDTRLRITLSDWKQFFEVDPVTLKATPVREAGKNQSDPTLASFLKPLVKNGYLEPSSIRSKPNTETLRLSDPDSFLMVYTAGPEMGATLIVARVTAEGKVKWKADTGLERFSLQQILPDEHFPAFVGTRPPVLGKVSEPLLVIINNQSAAVSPRSLWR